MADKDIYSVAEIVRTLNSLYRPNERIAVLWYDRSYANEVFGVTLTDDEWAEVVENFGNNDSISERVSDNLWVLVARVVDKRVDTRV
jgi:hypothetical protein